MSGYGLSNDQWERIAQLLPGKTGDVGVTAKDNRLFAAPYLTPPGRPRFRAAPVLPGRPSAQHQSAP
jgi:hypothetical protein